MLQKLIVLVVLTIPILPLYGQCNSYPSYRCFPISSPCPALCPAFIINEWSYDCDSAYTSCGECSQCKGNYTIIKDVPVCADRSIQQQVMGPESYQPCSKSIGNWPESKVAKSEYISIGPDDPIRKNGGQSLFIPLTAAVSLTKVNIERSCMEKGRPVVYASSGTDSFQIDAYFDGANIRVDLVSRILSKPLEDRQTLTNQMNHEIASSLAEKINGTLINN